MIRAAQEKVLEKQKENSDLRSMSTTLAVLYLSEEHAQWAHIGDSRIYWFQNGCLKEYTKDHSVPQLLVSLGQIRPDEVRGHPDQNRLLKVIGREWTENPFSVSSLHPLTGENHFLVCSDGFWEYIDERQMEQCLGLSSDPDQWLSRMDDTAIKQAAGMQRDNYSVICVRAV
jgi:serine/threonine protein phosphatase PrpC